ncbi:MAG: ATP-binding protein [Halorhabdus sp.]
MCIPVDEREEIFEASFTTAEDGTGLGLVIDEEIAAAHGWSIAIVECNTGGTRVAITNIDYP